MPVRYKSGKDSVEKPDFETDRESADKTKSKTPDTAGLEAIESRKKETKESTTEKTSGIKREVLEGEVVGADRETAEKIASIEIDKTTAEQLDKWHRLELVNHTLLAKLFDNGFKKEVLSVLESFRSIELPTNIELNGPEKIALRKLKEIASQTASPLFLELKDKWAGMIDNIHKTYERSAKTRDALFGPPKDKEKGKEDEDTGLFGFIKKHPIATAAVMTAGAYGIYKIFFAGDSKEESGGESGKKSSWFEKIKSKPGAILLGLLVLGGLIGPHRIAVWLDKGYDFTKEKVERFVQLLSEGRYKDAFVSLFEGNDDNMENYGKLAKIISQETGVEVTDSGIKAIANAKYSVFMSVVGRTKSFASTWVKEIPGIGSTLASFVLDSKEQAAEEDAIRKYFEKHQDKVGTLALGADATVFEALSKLNGLTMVTPGESGEKQEKGPVTEIVEAGTEKVNEVIAISGETFDQIKNEFKDCPHFQSLLEKYGKDKWKMLSPQFADDLVTAINKDGKGLAVVGSAIILWNGYKYITFTSVETIAKSVWAVLKSPFSQDASWTDSIKEYAKGSSVFVIAGIGMGALVGAFNKQGVIGGAISGGIKGGIKGFAYPITVVKAQLRFGQWVYRTARGAEFSVRKRLSAAEVRPKIMESEARYYADVFDKYDTLERLGDQASFYDPRMWYARLSKDRITKLKKNYLKKFAKVFGDKEFPGGMALQTKSENDVSTSENKLREWLKDQKKLEQGGKPSENAPAETITAGEEKPVLVKQEGTGLDAKHTYKYHNQEFVLTEKQIAEKAREIGVDERATGNIPKTEEEIKAWNESNWQKAIEYLAEDKILTPVAVEGKADTYRFAEQEVVITAEELKPKLASGLTKEEALKTICMEKAVSHVTVEEVRIVDGIHEYKIGGKWIKTEVPTEPAKLAEVKEAFVKLAKEKGTALDFEKFAAEAKSLKYLPVLEKTMGLAAAVGMIYYLETAKDKRKAVAETAAGFGSFWAGMKLTDWQVAGRIIKAPTTPLQMAARTVIDIMGGIATAYGLTEPISNIVTGVFETIPGSYGVGADIASIFEKIALRSTMRIVFASAENGLLKKLVMKIGLESVGAAFEKKIGGILLEKVGQLAAKTGFKQILKFLGWRGSATAAMIADDSTIIGALNDPIALGLIIWMGFDIYDIAKLIINAIEIKSEMEKRGPVKITSFEINDEASRKAFAEKLTPFGLTVDRAQELGEQAVFDILKTLPQTEVAIKREGMEGRESWTLNNGAAVGIAILDEMGRVKCQISGPDAESIDKALANMTIKEPS